MILFYGNVQWILHCICLVCVGVAHSKTFLNPVNVTIENHILFAGLFPIHGRGRNGNECGKINIERGIHRWQAMLFAIDQINKNANILPGNKISAEIYDTCEQGAVALEAVVKTVVKKVNSGDEKCESIPGESNGIVAGVIGAASSSVSAEVANLLRLFRLPQISYSSTSSILEDRKKYNYFTRTVPPDSQQACAMIDLVNHFKWTSVFILFSEGKYGESGYEALLKNARLKNVCVVDQAKVTNSLNLTRVLQKFQKHPDTKVIILFLRARHLEKLLKSASNSNTKYIWLASDYWGTRHMFLNTNKIKRAAEGAFTLTLKSDYPFEDFKNYFCSLKPVLLQNNHSNKTNEWLNEYWIEQYNCSISSPDCLAIPICQDIHFESTVPYVIDAVYALASAIEQQRKTVCKNGICDKIKYLYGEDILHNLMTLPYNGVYGPTRFDQNGSANHGYDIMYYSNDEYKRIGSWKEHLDIVQNFQVTVGESFCAKKCGTGQVKRVKGNSPICCYSCFECAWNQKIVNDTDCVPCKDGERSNATHDGCEKLPIRHISSSWTILSACLASVGVISTVAIAMIFYYHKDTEVVRTSAPELSFPLLIGITMCYLLSFAVIADQNAFMCGIRRFGLGFCFSICYSALLTKTNRIARVFIETGKSRRAPRFITASSQLVILFGLVFIEGGLATIGLYVSPPLLETREINKATEVIFVCPVPLYDAGVTLLYNLVLVTACTVYAFRTRKVPAAFNEARYIGFVMYTTCVIWLSFLPVYFLVDNVQSVVITLSINVTLNATSILAGLFGPKVYIIIFRPARNRRSTSMRSFSQSQSQSLDNSEIYSARKMTTYSLYSEISKHPYSER